jgi:FO synthase
VKMGPRGVHECLDAGVNDLGGTLMNESITRAAGAAFGEEMSPESMEALIAGAGRTARQRSTTYGTPPDQQVTRSFHAADLNPIVQTPAPGWARAGASGTLVRPGLKDDADGDGGHEVRDEA